MSIVTPKQEEIEAAEVIVAALERIAPKDRLGFLFGLTIGLLSEQGLDDIEIRAELDRALSVALQD